MEDQGSYISYRISVPPIFEAVFSHFYFAANLSEKEIIKTLIPSFQTLLVFCFGEPASILTRQNERIELNNCVVMGPVKHSFEYVLPSNSEILVANLKDDAFFRFFGHVHGSAEEPAHPDELLHNNCFTTLWYQINEMKNNDDRVKCLLNFCQPYLRQRDPIAGQIAGFEDNNVSPVKELSKQNELTERTLQNSYKKFFGYSAKEVQRYKRFMQAIAFIHTKAAPGKTDWFEVIDKCGYYDQSQLIHDFKYYLNLSPSKYLKLQEMFCNPVL